MGTYIRLRVCCFGLRTWPIGISKLYCFNVRGRLPEGEPVNVEYSFFSVSYGVA